VIALADNDMQMRLAGGLCVPYPLLEYLLGLLNKLTMKIDCVTSDFADGVVLAKDELGGLLVVLVGFGLVTLALLTELVCAGAIPFFIRFARLGGKVLVLALLLAGQVAQAVVLALGVGRGPVVEGCQYTLAFALQSERV
jgi:hypothetical protein